MGLLQNGASLLNTARRQEGHNITYVYCDGTQVPMVATVGFTLFESDQLGVGIMLKRSVDFIIEESYFRSGSKKREPANGDVIRSEHSGTYREYEVLPEAGEAAVTPHDPRHDSYRIHTKERHVT